MVEPQRVLHIVDCLRTGGTERQLLSLLGSLDSRRFTSTVACFNRVGELLAELAHLDLDPREFPLKGSLLQPNTVVQLARIGRMCRRQKIELLHAHDFYSNLVAVVVGKLFGITTIVSRRDLANWLGARERTALALACRAADRVLCNSSAVAELALADGVGAEKICVIPNGIDAAAFDRAVAAGPLKGLPLRRKGTPTVLMVGSMHVPDKGHTDLLLAAERLAARGRKIDWLLVSDGALRPRLEARVAAMRLTGVHFLGRRDDVPALIAHADLVVHPSWAEGFPNIVLEAMCAGRPVVATRVGGSPELVIDGATGVLVDPRRPADLADAIERLLVEPKRAAQLGRMARRRVESRFTISHLRTATEALYTSLRS